MAEYGIQVKRSQIKNANHWHLRVFRLRVDVVDTNNVDANVFVYQRQPANPVTGEQADVWCAIASPVDLAELPVGEPDPDRPFPFFRQDYIEVDVRSQQAYDDLWATIKAELSNLTTALELADNLEVAETVWVGDEPAESDSASDSDSAS